MPDSNRSSVLNNNNYIVPNWFVRSASAILGIAVPWGIWTTVQLEVVKYHIIEAQEIRKEFRIHMADPSPHQQALRDLQRELQDSNNRLGRLEQKIDAK